SGKRIGDLSSPNAFCRVPLSARGESLGKRPLMLHVKSAKAVALLAVLLLSACRESQEAAAPAQAPRGPVTVAAVIRRRLPAVLESAQVELGYTKVVSPIDGLVGKTEVKAGALVGRGQSTLLTTVSTNDPIHCRFAVSERDYLAVARRAGERGQQDLAFEMILADGSVHPHKGRLVFIERLVDPTTGTIL